MPAGAIEADLLDGEALQVERLSMPAGAIEAGMEVGEGRDGGRLSMPAGAIEAADYTSAVVGTATFQCQLVPLRQGCRHQPLDPTDNFQCQLVRLRR